MKKLLSSLLSLCFLCVLCACGSEPPSIVGCWDTETPLFQTEEEIEAFTVIFYDGMEAEEKHAKNGNTYKSYQFDYVLEGETLTLYTGAAEHTFTVHFDRQNDTDTMQLTAPDGTVYSYVLSTRSTPGIH